MGVRWGCCYSAEWGYIGVVSVQSTEMEATLASGGPEPSEGQ